MYEIVYKEVQEKKEYKQIIEKVLKECFKEEKLDVDKWIITITLTTPKNIQIINKEYRNIDKATDVLSFPMFEQKELNECITKQEEQNKDILGDIVISLEKVEEQASEYGHSFERELSYMLVHGFYHLMGYDHIKEEDKKIMRPKEEEILQRLKITRK